MLSKETGQAGFEPATPGFGVRCSNQFELLTPSNLPFSMGSMNSTDRAKFPEGDLVRCGFFVLCRRIIFLLALLTG